MRPQSKRRGDATTSAAHLLTFAAAAATFTALPLRRSAEFRRSNTPLFAAAAVAAGAADAAQGTAQAVAAAALSMALGAFLAFPLKARGGSSS
jgi:hypothetical protein